MLLWRSMARVSFRRERTSRETLLAKSWITREHGWVPGQRWTQLQAPGKVSAEASFTVFSQKKNCLDSSRDMLCDERMGNRPMPRE